ncbi:MAG: single-stranded DNA-binding protein [Chitinophagales bacterium]|nr:single-stranded DNA-binding protein [Bacteroidota bacterium]MCB9044381.1 single-stranded DNA-binding protein [Chitinophagales bacterium]
MRTLNKVMIIGRLGGDPRIKYFENGAVKASLRIATDESYKTKEGERVELTEWHTVVLWRGLANIAEKYLKKGNLVYVEGKLRTRSWKDDAQQEHSITEIEASELLMLESPSRSSNSSQHNSTSDNDLLLPDVPEGDDLPF